MTLRERKAGNERTYPDETAFNETEWARKLGISPDGFIAARERGKARVNKKIDYKRGTRRNVTEVRDFPRIIKGLAEARTNHGGRIPFPWANGIDAEHNFTVTASSGTTLIYEHPRTHIVFQAVKDVVKKVLPK